MYVQDSETAVLGSRFDNCSGGSGGSIRVRGTKNGNGLTIGDKEKDGSFAATEFRGSRATNGSDTNGSVLYVEDTGDVTVNGHTLMSGKKPGESEEYVNTRSGAVYVAPGGKLHLAGSETYGPEISDYRLRQEENNNGAGIYVGFDNASKFGRVTLDGYVSFSNNLSGQKFSGKLGGTEQNGPVREDIFLWMTGNGNRNNVNKNNPSLDAVTVKGELYGGSDIWVWASDDNNQSVCDESHKHFMLGDQFGIAADEKISDETLARFKNARLDEDTKNDGASVLIGVRGVEKNCVYWGQGVSGSRKVILHKIVEDGSGKIADPAVSGIRFDIYSKREDAQAEGISANTVRDNDGNELKNLISGAGGVFYIGNLRYGTYYVRETLAGGGSEVFVVTVNADGAGCLTADADDGTVPSKEVKAETAGS